MNIIKIVAISGIAAVLSGCPSGQSQIEGAAPAVVSTGASHVHNVQGHGDVTHSHKGNSTETMVTLGLKFNVNYKKMKK